MLYRHSFVSINDTFIEIKSILGAGTPLGRLGEVWDTGRRRFHALAQTREGCLILQTPLTSTNTRTATCGCFVCQAALDASAR